MIMYGIAVGGSTVGDRFVEALAIQWVGTPRPGTAHQRFELAWSSIARKSLSQLWN